MQLALRGEHAAIFFFQKENSSNSEKKSALTASEKQLNFFSYDAFLRDSRFYNEYITMYSNLVKNYTKKEKRFLLSN